MRNYRYVPIKTASTRITFFDYVNAIKLFPIDYFAVGLGSPSKEEFTSLISRPEWQQHIEEKQIAGKDPLIKVLFNSSRKIIPFSEVDHIDSFGKEVMRQRHRHGIKGGIILRHQTKNIEYMVMLATGFSRFDYYAFLKKHHTKLYRLKHDLTKIIERDTERFLSA
ncbi:autoinducer binding domain-containing protein [Rickettsiella massiliensis]|uniref:autoinducer binding domain-containing protein n=1 Tax=Rickettsiella massiliensis TaxID=676517 RepID=UPI00029ADEAB|nr:autoinducer binding domain-containing protein [Rickettsiella massiliensis]